MDRELQTFIGVEGFNFNERCKVGLLYSSSRKLITIRVTLGFEVSSIVKNCILNKVADIVVFLSCNKFRVISSSSGYLDTHVCTFCTTCCLSFVY